MVSARAFKPFPLCSAKVGSSARFRVVVCKSSLLWYWGVHQPKYVHLPSLCSGMLVISALVMGGPSAKVGSSAKFYVLVCKSSLLWYQGGHWVKKVCQPSLV